MENNDEVKNTDNANSAAAPEKTEEEKRRELEQYHLKIKNLLRDFGLENIFDDAIKNKRIIK